MSVQLYINNKLADFNAGLNIKSQVYDINDSDIGSLNKSYTLSLPMTDNNRKLIGFIDNENTLLTTVLTGLLILDSIVVIKGKIIILDINKDAVSIIINGSDWSSILNDIFIDAIWTGSDEHLFLGTNVSGSWLASEGSLYRYPLIGFGKSWFGITSNIPYYYFVPMWNVYRIMLRICSTAKIILDSNSFFHSTLGKSLYVLCPWKNHRNDDFINNKSIGRQCSTESANRSSITHTGLTTMTVSFNKAFIAMDTGTGSNWSTSTDRYNVNESGSYRFQLKVALRGTHDIDGRFSSRVKSCTGYLKYYNGSTTTTLVSKTVTSAISFDDSLLMTLDTGYQYLVSGGYVYVEIASSSQAYNEGSTTTVYLGSSALTANMEISTLMDSYCIYPSGNEPQKPGDYLPHISASSFLKAIKQAFGLIFWYDSLNNKLYAHTFNDYIGTNVIDWTNKLDYSDNPKNEFLSSNYPKYTVLKYLPDTSDQVYNDSISSNSNLYKKTITLTSPLVENSTDEVENTLFSPTFKRNGGQGINQSSLNIESIWGNNYSGYLYPQNRPKSWNMRLLQWSGDVSPTSPDTCNWNYYNTWTDTSPTNKTTYPKAICLDMNDNYTGFSKRYTTINTGRKIELVVQMTSNEYLKFATVFNTAANEGFRALYKFNINNSYVLCYIQSIVFDGSRAKLELIQR